MRPRSFLSGIIVGLALVPAAGAGDVPPLYNVRIEPEFSDGEATLGQVMALIREHYYSDTIDDGSLWWGAIEGVLRRVSPPENPGLATIWTPERYEGVRESLEGVRCSIGIKSSFSPADGALTVTEVIPGGPAASLLQPHDRIVRIDGEPLRGCSVADVDARLKGEPDSRVGLKVVRDVAVFDLLVTRGEVEIPACWSRRLRDGLLYIRTERFSKGLVDELKEILEPARETADLAVILDLRNNGGGVFGQALACAHLFVPKGESVLRIVTRGSKITNYVSPNETPYPFRVILLVNEATASAAEIVAAALRDNGGATIVGNATYGKASMERTFTLDNGCRIKFTTGALFSPQGRSWHKNGLKPDVPVAMDAAVLSKLRDATAEVRLAHDDQLRAAVKLLDL